MTTFTDGVNTLVNGIYPVSYFTLPGVDEIQYPDTFWWSSKLRFASLDPTGTMYQAVTDGGARTSEVLEIDLGRIREVNYLNMDMIRAPLDIKIEYDVISTPDRAALWVPVQPAGDLPFDQTVTFDTNVRTAWFNGEYNFTDPKGNMVHTRYLRITFTRRDEPFPTATSAPFAWPVFAKQLRVGRYVAVLRDTIGPLLDQDTPATITPVDLPDLFDLASREARQRFVIPVTAIREEEIPNLLGFGVLIETVAATTPFDQSQTDQQVSYAWSIWDVTNESLPIKLGAGIENSAVTSGVSWLDFYLDDASIIPGDTTKVYELRVSSLNTLASSTIFTHTPNSLSSKAIPGTLAFTNASSSISTSVDTRSVVHVGDYLVRSDIPEQVFTVNAVSSSTITINVSYPGPDAAAGTGAIVFPFSTWDTGSSSYVPDGMINLVMRVWADTADEGRDVLGNSYRHITRRQQAGYVQDGTKAGWMSQPVPTPDAVEALYFDVRTTDDLGKPAASLIEAIHIAPRTPGVRMNVYYSQQGVQGEAPQTTGDWDYLLWNPVQHTYTLRRDEVIQLPQPIRAGFVKLEFTALNPLPFTVPTFPPLPPRQYRRFPTWVEDQFNNAQVRNAIQDWFLRNATPVQTNILKELADPVQEFAYQQREFLGALALGTIADSQIVNSGIVDIADKAIIDPVTASKIYVSLPSQYQNSLLLSVDPSSALGQLVIQRYDPTVINEPIEATAASVVDGTVPLVSTTNDRISESYQNIAQIPMRFNATCRHVYTLEEAQFNKKAFFVGIDSVQFLRNDYRVKHDDAMIADILHDDFLMVEDTFVREEGTGIPDNVLLYVSYSINPDVADEPVFFSGFEPVALSTIGAPARNVLVYSMPGHQGVQYLQNNDYELSYATDENGQRVNYIARSSLGARMVVPKQPTIYVDAGTVISIAIIPSPPTNDAAVVVGVAVITGEDGPFVPDYGTGTYGGVGNVAHGTYGDLASVNDDAATVVGVAQPSSIDTRIMVESDTVTGVAVITGTDTYIP